jgi:hypothetical protein
MYFTNPEHHSVNEPNTTIRQFIAVCFFGFCSFSIQAQFTATDTIGTESVANEIDPSQTIYENMAAGEFTPGRGFQVVKNEFASLNISMYAMARWLNQTPGTDTWTDHRDSIRTFDGRNDIYWHRAMLWFTGFLGTPKLTYMATVWSVTTTQQTLVYGNIKYTFNKQFTFGAGIIPNACIRSLQGPFPFFSSTDRTMAEDALRGGFTNGIFATGEILPRVRYLAAFGNNLSILGIKAANLTRHYSKSISLDWQPTTGEFGPRGGNGDFEHHEKVATRFGVSYCNSRENRFNNIGPAPADNTQVRLSDGVLFFDANTLAPGLTVLEATYNQLSVDLGFKYKGFALHTEFYYRTLSKIDTRNSAGEPVTSPIDLINDNGYTAQVMYMLIPKKLCLYVVNSMLIDEFERNPYEVGAGVNIYPTKTRSWRINAQAMSVHQSAGGGTFGLYSSGQTGTTFTIGTDILL